MTKVLYLGGRQAISGPPPDTPVAWGSLHDAVAERLRDLIVGGHLCEGGRLVEKQLCQKLQISRTPLREAFKVLAAEGLIEIMPNRGAFVSRLGGRKARETLAVLARLEALAGELACARATGREIAAVRKLHDQMMVHYARENPWSYFELNQRIHLEIVRLAGNDTLRTMHAQLHTRVKRFRFHGTDDMSTWAPAAAEHGDMIAALEARDGARLAAILQQHLEAAWKRVTENVFSDDPPVGLERFAR